jgi:hypothetical protein
VDKPDTSKAKPLFPHPNPQELEGGCRLLHRIALALEYRVSERRLMSPVLSLL